MESIGVRVISDEELLISSHQLPSTKILRDRIINKYAVNGCRAMQAVSIDHVSKEIGSSLLV